MPNSRKICYCISYTILTRHCIIYCIVQHKKKIIGVVKMAIIREEKVKKIVKRNHLLFMVAIRRNLAYCWPQKYKTVTINVPWLSINLIWGNIN